MPTIASSVVPPPKSWDEFEDITLSAAKIRWGSKDFERHGRAGQKQDGVDVFGHDESGNLIGIQCKNTVDGISIDTIEAEIIKAETFKPDIKSLYIATTAKRDAPIQKHILSISAARKLASKFSVRILFWDDICGDLAADDDVFFAHYPQFRSRVDQSRQHDRVLYDQLTSILKSDGVIGFLNRNNMAGFSFKDASLAPLRQFYYDWDQPEREFISPELETIRKALWEKAAEYLDFLSLNVFPTNTPYYLSVPPEWEDEQPERFDRVVGTLHRLAGEIVALHAEFVRTGRSLLIATGT